MTDIQINRVGEFIPHFRGVFSRNKLPLKPKAIEYGIVNMDNEDGPGTHWVAYKKFFNEVEYFDSFGNLSPPVELIEYLRECNIHYNHDTYQSPNTVICGHLCLQFLLNK